MKQFILFYIVAVFTSYPSLESPKSYSLTVEIEGLKNSKGSALCAIYNQEGSIPDEKYKNFFRRDKISITQNSAVIFFEDLPRGKYAVSVLHDENNNQKIDKKFILPKEGIGFSNYTNFGLTNRPNFSKASFYLDKNKTVTIKMIYK